MDHLIKFINDYLYQNIRRISQNIACLYKKINRPIFCFLILSLQSLLFVTFLSSCEMKISATVMNPASNLSSVVLTVPQWGTSLSSSPVLTWNGLSNADLGAKSYEIAFGTSPMSAMSSLSSTSSPDSGKPLASQNSLQFGQNKSQRTRASLTTSEVQSPLSFPLVSQSPISSDPVSLVASASTDILRWTNIGRVNSYQSASTVNLNLSEGVSY